MIRAIALSWLMLLSLVSAQAQGTFPSLVPPNQVVAGPNGGGVVGPPTPRALVLPDLPITLSGNTTTVATVTGALTNGHCVSIGSGGNIIDAGSACSGAGGGGTVNAGTIGQVAFYNSSGTAVSGETTVTPAQLPNPTASTLGGIESLAAVTSKWINQISTSGVPSATQPAFTDISGTLTNAMLAQMPADTVKCNDTSSLANAADCTAINLSGTTAATSAATGTAIVGGGYGAAKGSFLGTATTKWFSNDSPPVNINFLNDRVFIGDATKNPGSSPWSTSTDWFSNYFNSQQATAGYAINGTILVENTLNNNSAYGIVSAAQSIQGIANGNTFGGVFGFGINNNASFNTGAWGLYGECDQISSRPGGCIGAELDVVNFGYTVGLPDSFQQGFLNGIQNICGAGYPHNNGGKNCESAWLIGGTAADASSHGAVAWNSGITFLSTSVASQSLFGATASPAIQLPPLYALVWYSAHGVPVGGLTMDSGGNLALALSTIKVNGTASVNCSGVNAATVVVTDGIVTHC